MIALYRKDRKATLCCSFHNDETFESRGELTAPVRVTYWRPEIFETREAMKSYLLRLSPSERAQREPRTIKL